ncbi:MAG TPA: hypothetical protein DCL54_06320, partial [Alphaproteobacteria bacterium]|nr:hypothetical protein [Alphaproteobacteria bacterium]
RRMLKAVLAAGGHAVREASSGLEGIELLGTVATDVILLDLDMPDLDGAATARLIRALPAHQDTPIIAVSGHEQEHIELSGLSELADAVLVKPIAADRLLAEIDRVCALRPVQSQIAAVREPSGAKAASAG